MTIRPIITAGTMLGVGLGGFIDGILMHQLLQLHNMLSARLPKTSIVNIEINMFWDGIFHLLTWGFTVAGLALLWRGVRRRDIILSTRALNGSMLLGWGFFNLVEGIINHHILNIHHVVETADHSGYDLAFLASGLILILAGVWLIGGTRRSSTVPAT